MKKSLLFILLITALSSYAQDPQLFENTWYLQKVIINEQEYLLDDIEELDNVNLIFSETSIYTTACETIFSNDFSITNNFINANSFSYLPDGDCMNEDIVYFQNIYFDLFFNWQEPNTSFGYEVELGDNNYIELRLINTNYDKAIYGNELLANQDVSDLGFSFYPNPASDVLIIENSNQTSITKIKVFDVLGKLVLEQYNPSNQIAISKLPTGLFFIHIQTDNGTAIKKIIKE